MKLKIWKKIKDSKSEGINSLGTKQNLTKIFPVLTAFAMSAKTKFATETFKNN